MTMLKNFDSDLNNAMENHYNPPPPKPPTPEEKQRMLDRMKEAEEFAKKRLPRKKRSMWTGHGR